MAQDQRSDRGEVQRQQSEHSPVREPVTSEGDRDADGDEDRGQQPQAGDAAPHGSRSCRRSHNVTWAGCMGVEHDRAELGADGLQVDLLAEAARERLKGERRVVPASVEAAVDDGLDAAAEGPEQSGNRQRGRRDGQVGLAGQRLDGQPEQQHGDQVDDRKRRGERRVDQRAVDDDVDVVEPVPQDCARDRHRHGHQADGGQRVAEVDCSRARVGGGLDEDRCGQERQKDRDRPGQPLQLLALLAARVEVAHHQGCAAEPDAKHEQGQTRCHHRCDQFRGRDADRVRDMGVLHRSRRGQPCRRPVLPTTAPTARRPAATGATAGARRGTAAAGKSRPGRVPPTRSTLSPTP